MLAAVVWQVPPKTCMCLRVRPHHLQHLVPALLVLLLVGTTTAHVTAATGVVVMFEVLHLLDRGIRALGSRTMLLLPRQGKNMKEGHTGITLCLFLHNN